MASEALKKARSKYDHNNTVQVKLKLNKKTDGDIINKLGEVENKSGYIKNLIRKDIHMKKRASDVSLGNFIRIVNQDKVPAGLKHLNRYVNDGGYSILAVPEELFPYIQNNNYEDYEVPLPTNYVLEKGWEFIKGSDSILVNVEYDKNLGAIVPDGYEEF